ncbi:myoferlin-like [Diadema antillarum]|uniref:myoferlin-like n=1 Tax=Diadema antillarum TaxID=105358 RepID=UPI003A835A21
MSLQLIAKSAKNLPNLEVVGKVDPYLTANFQGIKRKTQCVKSDLNPAWNQTLAWDLGTKPLEHGDFIEIDVRDWERVGRHRLIGCCKVSLKDVIRAKERETQTTIQLRDGSDRVTTGEIELHLKYQPPSTAASSDLDVSESAHDPAAPGAPPPARDTTTDATQTTDVKEGADAYGGLRLTGKMSRDTLSTKPTDFQIRVKVWEGRQLHGTNINPVCRVTIQHNTQVTRVKKSTSKPYWDELFFFQFNMSPAELFDEIIQLQVLDSHLVRSDAVIGTFQLDIGTVYQSEDHTLHNKWLLLTVVEESKSSAAKGYLLVSISIIGQGDEAPILKKADEDYDIETNLLHPAGIDIRKGCFKLRVFQAEDLPQMDPSCFEGVKKVLRVGEEQKELVDPYLVFTFAGKSLKTDVKYTNDHPEWNQELRLPIRFPSMCERLKLILRDWDRLSTDDFIATAFLELDQIGSRGDEGYLPTFGPCFVNFYGSPREFDSFNGDYDELNRGRGHGAAYRGRVLVSMATELGDPPEEQIVSLSNAEMQRLDKFRRRRKYHLYAAFINATMISETDRPVEFEVSIGNFGNKFDERVTPQPSTTQPSNAVFDGNHYYFLPWMDNKPLIVISSEWEDISHRLDPLNILNHIIVRLEANIESVRTSIRSGDSEKDIATQLITMIDRLIEVCKTPLPDFGANKNYANELDQRRYDFRRRVMLDIVERATALRDRATDIDETLDEVEEYLMMLQELAVEPQNSIPDVVVWMLCGSKRTAYIRVPAYEVLYSAKGWDACGRYCGRTFSYFLQYVKPSSADDGLYTIPAMLRLKLWLGLEEHSENFRKDLTDSSIAVYAETYENQRNMMGQWSDKALISRAKYSDASGKLNLPKNKFTTPKGWRWDGDWFVNLDASLLYDADAGLKHFLEDCFEQQVRFIPGGEWVQSTTPFTNVKGDPVQSRAQIECPAGWKWDDAWQVDINRACDDEGYEYCVESTSAAWTPASRTYHMCRRKRWVRPRSLVKEVSVQETKEDMKADGWEYAPMFHMRFHATERKMDIVRRRRWHRKMIPSSDTAASIFELRRSMTEEKTEKEDQAVPRIFLEPKEVHKYQLRAYMFQARNLIAADSDNFSDPFAFVSILFRSQRTHFIKHSLSPQWDQTLIFEEIVIHGDPRFVARHPPDIVVEIYDHDAYKNDEFLGRAKIKPMVKLQPSDRRVCRLAWHDLQRGQRDAGELLASFELFLQKSHSDLPFMPPMKQNRYVVPSGIRPVMQHTAVEILCWGVRNLSKFMQMNVTSPSVEFEIGGKVLESQVIKNVKTNPNFDQPILILRVDLPREELYTPPINIKVRDHRAFGRKPIVGITAISGLAKYRRIRSLRLSTTDDRADDVPGLTLTRPDKKEYEVIDMPDGESSTDKSRKVTLSAEDNQRKKKISMGGLRRMQWWQRTRSVDPEAVAEEEIDWWSKYYASIGDTDKCVSYLERGYDTLELIPYELEKVPEFNGFSDFCDTFSLTRGKVKGDQEPSNVGEFKGSFKIYPLPPEMKEPLEPMFFKQGELPHVGLVECIVRVYVVRAHQLCPMDRNGLSDPYVIVSLGNKKQDDNENYVPNTLDPFFGRLFEIKTVLPIHKDLVITVMDRDLLSRDDMIGQTVIDLENRFLTQYRATCGLPQTYNISGPNIWRDTGTPRQLLAEHCKRHSMAPPIFEDADPPSSVIVGGETFNLIDLEANKIQNEHWGPADQRLALYALRAQKLVREHVETRKLYNPVMPDLVQGHLEMWVDIFPSGMSQPGPPFDITVRKAKKFQLRCVIWNTVDVILDETSITGERMSDIYVKGWLAGQDEKQETDVHYRSLNGEGNFNWRFVFDMDYIPPERVLVVKRKEHFWSVSATEIRVPPTFVIQIWDNDKFSADDFLGAVELDLNRMVVPAKKSYQCSLNQLPGGDGSKKGSSRQVSYMSLFDQKRVRGWWPCYCTEGDEDLRTLAGKVEMELEILDEGEIEERPTAPGRDEPNQHPHLDPPNRPETSFLWFTSPWKSIRFIIWYNYKWYIIIGILVILLIIFLILFIYNVPGASVNAVFN